MKKFLTDYLLLPMIGIAALFALWAAASSVTWNPEKKQSTLPGPVQTWEESKLYILEPLAYRGENDQGVLRMTCFAMPS